MDIEKIRQEDKEAKQKIAYLKDPKEQEKISKALEEKRIQMLADAEYKKMMDEEKQPKEEGDKTKYKKKEKEKPTKEVSFLEDENYLYEQVYNGKNHYARYNKTTEEIDYVENIEKEDCIYQPIEGEEIQKKVVLLPTQTEEYNTEKELDEEISKYINSWLDVDDTYRKFTVWNIRFSWLYDRFNTLNYIRAIGDTGTGKSRFLDTIGNICYKPMRVSGALTPAVIFRIIDKWKGTLCIDEGDQKSSEESDAFIKIMNCGYEKGRAVSRVDKDNHNKLQFFEVYCPKVVTTRKRFEDKATEARCMTKIMTQTNRRDIPVILTKKYEEQTCSLRNKLLLYRLRNYNKINPELGLQIEMSEFEPRLQQVNVGFIGLFSKSQEDIEEFKAYLREYQEQIIQERADSYDGGIVQSLADFIISDLKHITCEMIARRCNEAYATKYEATAKGIGIRIRSLGLNICKPKKVDGQTIKEIDIFNNKDQLNTLFNRYIVDLNIKEKLIQKGYAVTIVTVVTHSLDPDFRGQRGGEVTQTTCLHIHGNHSNSVTEQPDRILLPCSFCGLGSSCKYLAKNGKPVCDECAESLKVNYMDVNEENIE